MANKNLMRSTVFDDATTPGADGELTAIQTEELNKEQANFYRQTQQYTGVELTFTQLLEQVSAVADTEISQEVAEIADILSQMNRIQSELNAEQKISYALALSVLVAVLSVLASTRSEFAFAESLIAVLFVISTIVSVGIRYHKFHRESSYEDDHAVAIRPTVQLEHLERQVTGKLKLVLDTYDESMLPDLIGELLHRHQKRT